MDKPPFSFPPLDLLQQFAGRLPAPPAWLQAELHNRLVLLLNHVLQQEPQAMDRLRRQQGKRLRLNWGSIQLELEPTAAGLLALGQQSDSPDLQLRVAEASPLALAQTLLAGGKPPVEIQGDVQLAAEIGWLVDNLRWDLEEDLSRLFGDVQAHRIASAARMLVQALRGFLQQAAARFPKAPS
ncbi:MAG: hypothetical protein RLZZ555_1007 [Pseudomonadota bacterium]|jgi:ubiquinone biosynthesis protein UbiJ